MSERTQYLVDETDRTSVVHVPPHDATHVIVSRAKMAKLRTALAAAERERDALVAAIDSEMTSAHIGVFNAGDDPRTALNALGVWHQGVGEYFAKGQLAAAEQRAERAEAKAAEAADKALRFDLDRHGIEQREAEAVELVELRATVARVREVPRYKSGHIHPSTDGVFMLASDILAALADATREGA